MVVLASAAHSKITDLTHNMYIHISHIYINGGQHNKYMCNNNSGQHLQHGVIQLIYLAARKLQENVQVYATVPLYDRNFTWPPTIFIC